MPDGRHGCYPSPRPTKPPEEGYHYLPLVEGDVFSSRLTPPPGPRKGTGCVGETVSPFDPQIVDTVSTLISGQRGPQPSP